MKMMRSPEVYSPPKFEVPKVVPPPEARLAKGGPPQETPEVKKPTEKFPGLEVKFVYVTHTPEHENQIFERIKDADLFFVEVTEVLGERKSTAEKDYNRIFARPPKERGVAARKLKESPDLTERLIGGLIAGGKDVRIKFIDVERGYRSARAVEHWDSLERRIRSFLHEGKAWGATKFYPSFVEATMEMNYQRERLVQRQLAKHVPRIKDRAQEKPEGFKVVVLQGAGHTAAHHRFKEKHPDIETKISFDVPLTTYPQFSYLSRRRTLNPEEKITKEEYLSGFIGDYIFAEGASEILGRYDPSKIERFSHRLTRALNPEDLKEILTDYEEAFAERKRRYGGIESSFTGYERYQETSAEVTKRWAQKLGIELPKAG